MMKSATFLALAVLTTVLMSPAAEAKTCKSKKVSYSATYFYGQAREIAISGWRGRVTKKYGAAYALWGLAKSKSVKCKNASTTGQHTCKAKAKPCKP